MKSFDDKYFKYPVSTFRCYESHKPLPIGEYLVYGGSCVRPIVSDADVYVGFDYSMGHTDKSFPWVQGDSFLFTIPDRGVPSNPKHFIELVDWLVLQLIANKKIHAGCIGGHGRTGMVLSALVKVLLGTEDAITYVRENYCKKAVESAAQVRFLHEHFGITTVKGAKEVERILNKSAPVLVYPSRDSSSTRLGSNKFYKEAVDTVPTTIKKEFSIKPVTSRTCIFGPELFFDRIPNT